MLQTTQPKTKAKLEMHPREPESEITALEKKLADKDLLIKKLETENHDLRTSLASANDRLKLIMDAQAKKYGLSKNIMGNVSKPFKKENNPSSN
jgi:hypothetical protein